MNLMLKVTWSRKRQLKLVMRVREKKYFHQHGKGSGFMTIKARELGRNGYTMNQVKNSVMTNSFVR